ncbi:redoxin domain-containing protein [Patulibacter sp. S7RM1-6]
MRVPAETIPAPPFPRPARWVNVAMLRMDQQKGRPVLVEFCDFARPASVRSVEYLQAWHERYEPHGLRVVGVHWPGSDLGRGREAVEAAARRLGVTFPVLVDDDGAYRDEFEAPGWPARYLFDGASWLVEYEHGEGGYRDTETAILELLGLEAAPLAPLRPVDDDDALLVVPTVDQPGAYSGPYTAGEVWAVLEPPAERTGTLEVNGETVVVDHPGAYRLIVHETSTSGALDLAPGDGTVVHGVSFAPGLAPAPRA